LQVQKSNFIDPVPALLKNIDIYISRMNNCPKCESTNILYSVEQSTKYCDDCGYVDAGYDDDDDDAEEDNN
jgi:ribosomal protein L37AE/L43A